MCIRRKDDAHCEEIYSPKNGLENFNLAHLRTLTLKAAARVSASSPQGDAAFACYV
jgi:hypothetical protein